MGDWLDLLEETIAAIESEAMDLNDRSELVSALEDFMASAREERESKDRAWARAADTEDKLREARGEVGRLQGVEVDIRRELGKAQAELVKVRGDVEAAAGELLVPIPEPGTDMAKLLTANVLLRRERDSLQADLTIHRSISTEAVAILHQLHVQEGLDLDGEVTLLMAKVRVAAGGGCGTCPLRRNVAQDFVARSGRSPVRSTCGHPEVEGEDLLQPQVEADVTRSQREAVPAPAWCPLRGLRPDYQAEEDTPPVRSSGRTPWGQVTQ